MIIESGVIIFLGLLLLFVKAPHTFKVWCLKHDLLLDLSCAALAYILHWGTFTGVMAAAVAGLMCSGFTMVAKHFVKEEKEETMTIEVLPDGSIRKIK